MILFDANVLTFCCMHTTLGPAPREGALLVGADLHPAGADRFCMDDHARVSPSEHESARVRASLPSEEAVLVSSWIARPNAIILHPGERHWQIFSTLLTETLARGPLVMDAHLAALAIEHGAELAMTDKDFVRFPGLRVIDPLDN